MWKWYRIWLPVDGIKYVWNVAWRKEYSYKLEGETWSCNSPIASSLLESSYWTNISFINVLSGYLMLDKLICDSENFLTFRLTLHRNYVLARSKFWSNGIQVSADQRQRLMMSTERLNRSSDRIRDSRKTMLETEDLGVSILQDLHQQRQSLLHAHDTVHNLFIFVHPIWTA